MAISCLVLLWCPETGRYKVLVGPDLQVGARVVYDGGVEWLVVEVPPDSVT